MANMEFLGPNLLNTTTLIVLDTGQNTGAAEFVFDGNRNLGWTSTGYNSNTSAVFSVEFGTNLTISNVLIQNHNLRVFRIFYNSVSTNSLIDTSGISDTSTYVSFSTITVSSIQLQMDGAQTSNSEKGFGEFIIAERQTQFERNPSISDFKPITFRKQVRHIMPDGGVALYNVRDKLKVKLSWDFITTSFHNTLKDIYDPGNPLVFIQFPTATSWTGEASEVVWSGNFDFKHSTNDKNQGFSGSINLEQTANT